MSLKAGPYDSDTTLTHRELLAARGYSIPALAPVCPVEPRKLDSGTHTTPKRENAT